MQETGAGGPVCRMLKREAMSKSSDCWRSTGRMSSRKAAPWSSRLPVAVASVVKKNAGADMVHRGKALRNTGLLSLYKALS
jgi:hypothetical protein